MKKQYFYNVWKMVGFLFKHDKWKLIIWVAALLLFDLYALPYINSMYPTQEARDGFKLVLENPAMIAMFGKGYGFDNYTVGAFYAHMMYVWLGLFNGLMAVMIVSKQLRAEEEEGRLEVIRSLPVGRNATLLASMIVMTITFVVFVLIKPITYLVLGIPSIDFAGSLNLSIGLGLIGIFFSFLTAVIAQVFQSNRTVMGVSFGLFLGLYLLFSIGILSSDVLLWLSPFQWMVESQAFVNNYYWPFLITIGVTLLLGLLALYFSSIRDLDAGLIKQKTKEHKTKEYIRRPFGFALRLSKTVIIGWVVAMFVFGASYGSIFGDLETFIEGNDMLGNILPENSEYSTTVLFMSFIITVLAIVSLIPSILIMNKLSSEERKGRMELLFSHPVSRHEIAISYYLLALFVGIITLSVSALGLYSAASGVMVEPIAFRTMLSAIIVYVPSLIVFLGFSLFLSGFLPEKTWIIWVYLGFGFFVVYLGMMLGIEDWVTKFTPFGYVPNLPIDDMNWFTQIALVAIGFLLSFVGVKQYLKRNSL
jgi:ABC-2 type transport system permease protein